jgi:hypothetical protein
MYHNSFWARVNTAGPDECWPWVGPVNTGGYGQLCFGDKTQRAHRIAYQLTYGVIPQGDGHHGVVVMHKCDNRRCCNPEHLLLGSHADNMADMRAKGRANRHAGVENGRAVLAPRDVERIRRDPRGTRTIAKDYPVSRAAVQRIKSGKAWSCLAP